MKSPSTGYDSALLDLAAWCGLAHDMLTPSMAHPETERLRNIKRNLQHLHGQHLLQLQPWLVACERRLHEARRRRPVWTEVQAALHASDDRVALAACALLHRAVIAAYERAADQSWMEPDLLALIRQQRGEVTDAYAACFIRPVTRPAATPRVMVRATTAAVESKQLTEPLAS